VNACAFGPDGARVLSASQDCSIRVWDLKPGRKPRRLTRLTNHVGFFALSPDGTRVVSAGWDWEFILWSAQTGRVLSTFKGHSASVGDCAFSPDGAHVVSASRDQTLRLWDVETGRELRTLTGHTNAVRACAFSPDGAHVVSAGEDRSLRLWDVETGACLAVLPLLGNGTATAHHPVRGTVACGDYGGSFYLADLLGVTVGSLVVTAVDLGDGPSIRCPVCRELRPLKQAQLGREMDCPGDACRARLKVNPFVVRRRRSAPSWIERLWRR
jgi:WD40 repeat protein